MLSPKYLDNCTNDILEIYGEYEAYILKDIAKRVAKMNNKAIPSTAEWQIEIAQEMGLMREHIIEYLAGVNNVSEAEMAKLFSDAGIKTLKFDDAVYKSMGLDPIPIQQSPAMLQILTAGMLKNSNMMKNLTMTTAVTAPEALHKFADLAYTQIASGAFTYQDAIKNAVSGLTSEGIKVLEYGSGARINLLSGIRRSLVTGVNQTAAQLQVKRAEELDSDLVETSAHIGARPEHAEWQGKVFSLSGKSKKYPHLATATGYGSPAGLCGVNCRHNFYPFFEGLSLKAYNKDGLAELQNKTVSYTDPQGKTHTMSYYDGTQKLRSIEGNIRHWKIKAEAFEEAGVDASFAKSKVKQWQMRAKDFTAQTGIKRDYFREKVISSKAPVFVKSTPAPKTPVKRPITPDIVDNVMLDKSEILVMERAVSQVKNKKWHSIWIDDVGVEDYQAKKASGSIKAKKEYYKQQEAKAVADQSAYDIALMEKMQIRLGDYVKESEKYLKTLDDIQAKKQALSDKIQALSLDIQELERMIEERLKLDMYSDLRKASARKFTNAPEADAFLREATEKWWKQAKEIEKEAAHKYTGGSGLFNRPLRGFDKSWHESSFGGVGKISLNNEGAEEFIHALTGTLKTISYDEDIWLFRGLNDLEGAKGFFGTKTTDIFDGDLTALKNELMGKVVKDEGFLSTAGAQGRGFGGQVKLEIYAPKGTNMLYCEPFSAYSGDSFHLNWDGVQKSSNFGQEFEVIIQRGQYYKVIDVEKDTSGRVVVKIEVRIDQN